MNKKEKAEKLKELVKDKIKESKEVSNEVSDIEPKDPEEKQEQLKISPFCENGFYRETKLNIAHKDCIAQERIAVALEKIIEIFEGK